LNVGLHFSRIRLHRNWEAQRRIIKSILAALSKNVTTTLPALHYPWEQPPSPGDAHQLADGVYWIRMPLPFALDHINLWLLEDERDGVAGWTIVDCGYGSDETRALWDQHFAHTMGGRPVHRIIVTHYHPDHVGNAAWLQERTGAPVWMTATEYMSAHAAADDAAGFDRTNSANLFIANGLARSRPDFVTAQQTRVTAFKRGVSSVPRQFVRIMDGDDVTIGKRTWRVRTVYGHAPEHATLFSPTDNLLISGDQVLPKITTNVGVWGNQPEANPLKQFLTSFDKFADLPDSTLVLPSHGRVFAGLHTRIAQLKDHHAQRLAELEAALTEPKSAADVLPVLFRRTLDDHQLIFAIGEAIAHLHYLWYAGRAKRIRDAEGIYLFVRTNANM
jgi:glyoxylase-like metal-dependent hydrolase (beta-lactamase superfamily II)